MNTTIDTSARVSSRALILLGLIVVLAAVLRLVDLERAPMGGHGDVAWIGLNALDWVDRGIWPFYIRELYAPEPLIVYLTGLLLPVAGVSYLAPRLVTTAFGLLFVALLFPATWWLLDDAPRATRERASLLASLGAAVSLHAMFLSRLGMESPLFPAALTLFVWLTVHAWRRGGWQRWALAGAALAFTQYIYLPARLLPLVLLLWIAHSAWAERERLRAQARGGLVMALVAFVLVLPALILFVTTPEAFSARADVGSATSGGWIWKYDLSAQGGLGSVLLQKLARILLAFGLRWDGPYTVMSQPMLGPIFFVGLLVALVVCFRYPKRPAYAWPVLAIPVLLITDLVSGTDVEPHALHQIGVLPFVFILAGVGLAHAWDVLDARLAGSGRSIGKREAYPYATSDRSRSSLISQFASSFSSQFAVSVALVVLAVVPGVWGTTLYLTVDIPRQYADPRNGWLTEQTDVDISRRILAEPGRAYLLPYEEFSRANLAWLLSDVFRDRRSAIDGQGTLRVPALPPEFTVVMPADPYRPRHDGSPSQFDTRLWVLLVGRQALLLPPLASIQQADIEQFIRQVNADAVVDQSGTLVATLFSGPIPPGLFAPRSVIDYPLDATFNDEIRLRGYTLTDPDLTPGSVTFVTLYWQPIDRRPAEDFEVITQIWNDAGQAIARSHDFPYGGAYRPRIWQPDEIVATHAWLSLPNDLPAGRYTLVASLYRLLENERVPTAGADAEAASRVARAPDLRRPAPPPVELGAPPASPIRFGEVLDVVGLDVVLEGRPQPPGTRWHATPGQTLTLGVVWGALTRPPLDYSVFVHLGARADGTPVAQTDRTLGGSYPSGAWRSGDRVADPLELVLPDDLAPGTYPVWLGVYYWQTGERLTARVGSAVQPDGRVWLGSIVVE